MIKVEKEAVYGWEAAIRGMRNPLNSWDKSDSVFKTLYIKNKPTNVYIIGEKDISLMTKLVKAGNDHSKFMRMLTVTCDITAPRFWWTEMDTYKIATVRNSCSTMHTITNRDFTKEDFSINEISPYGEGVLYETIEHLNKLREYYLKETDEKLKKEYWRDIIAILPQSYNQKATMQFNYAVLKNIYNARKNHKLMEWHEFCKWIESLPQSFLITGKDENNGTD